MKDTSASLLDQHDIWRSDPMEGFRAFIGTREFIELGRRKQKLDDDGDLVPPAPIRDGSAKVYIAMFQNFVRWLSAKNLDLFEVTAEQIMAFLNDRSNERKAKSSTIRTRYLRLLERVYIHLKVKTNPAGAAAVRMFKTPGESGKDAPKAWLNDDDVELFMANLPVYSEVGRAATWKVTRDRAMLAMMLGAGLKVSEVINLYVENVGQIDDTGSVKVTVSPASTDGLSMWHDTYLRPFAVPVVMEWLRQREEMGFAGPLLFPSDTVGRHGPKPVDPSTLYLHVKNTFERANINPLRRGGRTLRNTFALRELLSGKSEHEVQMMLGLHEKKSVEKYLPLEMRLLISKSVLSASQQ